MKFTARSISAATALWAALHGGAAAADPQAVSAALRAAYPTIEITRVRESRIPGLYEVMIGTEVVYASADGRYIIQGDLYDVTESRNLSSEHRMTARAAILKGVPAAETIDFTTGDPRHTLYVFTDVTCGYCRKLHQDVPELNRMGISVRYLAFPRKGPGSGAFREMESVWCADDRQQALTAAKQGRPVTRIICPNPVARQFVLGEEMGVRGTPAIFLEDGRSIRGYRSPDELAQILNGE